MEYPEPTTFGDWVDDREIEQSDAQEELDDEYGDLLSELEID